MQWTPLLNSAYSNSSATSDITFGTLKILVILEYIPIFFSKRPLSPLVVECKVVSFGTLFHPRATLKLGERGKFWKYAKVSICFVQGCRYQISLRTNMSFRTKYAQKWYLRSKPKKANIPIKFCMLELV